LDNSTYSSPRGIQGSFHSDGVVSVHVQRQQLHSQTCDDACIDEFL
jgi:hypothetical protein